MNDNIEQKLRDSFPSVIRFRETLTPESDRGCALIAVAYLDESMYRLLRECLVSDDKVARAFMRPDGPLGSFSSRIDCAYLLGRISPTIHRELHLIRKIRNDFGHNSEPITFEYPPVASRCSELQYSGRTSESTNRGHFTSSVCGCLAAIHVSEISTEQPEVRTDRVPNEEDKKSIYSLVDRAFKIIGPDLPATLDEESKRQVVTRAYELVREMIIAEQYATRDQRAARFF